MSSLDQDPERQEGVQALRDAGYADDPSAAPPLVNEKVSVSIEMAYRLSKAFGSTPARHGLACSWRSTAFNRVTWNDRSRSNVSWPHNIPLQGGEAAAGDYPGRQLEEAPGDRFNGLIVCPWSG